MHKRNIFLKKMKLTSQHKKNNPAFWMCTLKRYIIHISTAEGPCSILFTHRFFIFCSCLSNLGTKRLISKGRRKQGCSFFPRISHCLFVSQAFRSRMSMSSKDIPKLSFQEPNRLKLVGNTVLHSLCNFSSWYPSDALADRVTWIFNFYTLSL